MGLLILYFLLTVLTSFTCSLLEASFLSITPSFIAGKINENKMYAKAIKRFKDKIDTPLAAILTINTIANTMGAVGVGIQAQEVWGNEYLSIVSGLLTIVILIFSEIVPKTIGAIHWKKIAPYVPMMLNIMIYSPFFPIIFLAKFVTSALRKDKSQTTLSRTEFHAMAKIGIKEGLFKEEESKILSNLMIFNNIVVESIMTPRIVVLAAPEETTIKDFFEMHEKIRFSRIPIYKDDIDNITGYILKDDLMQNMIEQNTDSPLSSIARNIMVVNERIPIIRLFYRLIGQKEHIAMIVGEYGEMVGIVTMEDIIETLLGTEIMDEFDNIEDMQEQAKKNWEKRAKKLGLI